MSPPRKDIWSKVQKSDDGCWIWTGSLDTHNYGCWWVADERKLKRAHRVIYELCVGPIPKGLTLDHECHNRDATCSGGDACLHRRCVRPDHLIPRTQLENVRASPHTWAGRHRGRSECRRGHRYDEENTYVARGKRYCRACQRINNADRWQRLKAASRERVVDLGQN